MLILVGVTINVALNGGLFRTANQAVTETQIVVDKEQLLSAVVAAIGTDGKVDFDYLDVNLPEGGWTGSNRMYTSPKGNVFTVDANGNIISEGGGNEEPKEYITTTPSAKEFIGYYADVNNDGTPDGVIYADLVEGVNGTWGGVTVNVSADTTSTFKNYYISSETDYAGAFGTKPVLSAEGNGSERFYVMALKDISSSCYYWYYNGSISDYSTAAKTGFGEGKTNTANMIAKWNADTDANKITSEDGKSCIDMWGAIQTKEWINWYVPSKDEFAAFASNLGISSSGCLATLSVSYWSSSLDDCDKAWYTINGMGIFLAGGFQRRHQLRRRGYRCLLRSSWRDFLIL